MSQFIKDGTQIVPKPQGMDYDLIPGKVYNLNYKHGWTEYPYIEEDGVLDLPSKIYDEDTFFIERILNTFNTDTNNVGALLTGLKGSGKSLTAKVIAKKSGLPILVVSPSFPSSSLKDFFTTFETPVCVIFDEVDKNRKYWDTEEMLNFLDGIQSTTKKLVVMTCNETCNLSDFVLDRCSRIKYFKEYNGLTLNIIKEVVTNMLGKEDDELSDYINTFLKVKSFDNIIIYLKEIIAYPDHDKYKLLDDMNITIKKKEEK